MKIKELLESMCRICGQTPCNCTSINEAAKPKGVVDKKFGKPEKESKSSFKVGQKVAIYKGHGETVHGTVKTLDIKSGGKTGAMVTINGSQEFYPYSEMKDLNQYWKDEEDRVFGKGEHD